MLRDLVTTLPQMRCITARYTAKKVPLDIPSFTGNYAPDSGIAMSPMYGPRIWTPIHTNVYTIYQIGDRKTDPTRIKQGPITTRADGKSRRCSVMSYFHRRLGSPWEVRYLAHAQDGNLSWLRYQSGTSLRVEEFKYL